MEKVISLNKVTDVKDFISATQKCVGEVTVSSLDGHYRVDGKSILGLFSLDLSAPVNVYIEDEKEGEQIFKRFN